MIELGIPPDSWTDIKPPVEAASVPLPPPTPTTRPASPARHKVEGKTYKSPWKLADEQLQALNVSQLQELTTKLIVIRNYLTSRLRHETAQAGLKAPSLEVSSALLGLVEPIADHSEPNQELENATAVLIASLELQHIVTNFEDMAEEDIKAPSENASQIVHIDGQPFLLFVPEDYRAPREDRLAAHKRLRNHQGSLTVIKALTKLVEGTALRNRVMFRGPNSIGMAGPMVQMGMPQMQIALPDIAGQGQPGPFPVNAGPQPAMVAATAAAGAQRNHAMAVVVNLDELRRTIVPLVWLSFKLGFLLYIFGRHASYEKRVILGCMAAGWVVWEALALRNRRAQEGRRMMQNREEAQRERRRAAGIAQPAGARPQPGQPQQQPLPAPLANNGLRPGLIFQRALRHNGQTVALPQPTTRGSRYSIWTLRYWVYKIACIGLAAEAREMGLYNPNPNRRPPSPPRRPETPDEIAIERYGKMMRNVIVCFVLFFGTLAPGIERKRKKALEKREKLKGLCAADRERYKAAQEKKSQARLAASVPATPDGSANVDADQVVQEVIAEVEAEGAGEEAPVEEQENENEGENEGENPDGGDVDDEVGM